MLGFIDWTISLLKLVCDFVYIHNLFQLVDCPTHVKGNILDLVLTTSESIISDLLVSQPHALISTDHHTVNILHNQRRVTNACMFLTFLKADFGELCNHLLETVSVTVTTLLLWKTYGQQSNMPFCMLWICTYQWRKSSFTNILSDTTQT